MSAKRLFRAALFPFAKLFTWFKPKLEEDRRWLKYAIGTPVLILILCSIGIVALNEIFPRNPVVLLVALAWNFVLLSYSLFLLVSLFVFVLGPVFRLDDDTTPDLKNFANASKETHQSRTEAITLLGFATAVFGFGVFNAASNRSLFQQSNWLNSTVIQTEILCFFLSLILYLATIMSIRPILLRKIATGKHVAEGPLFMMFLLVLAVAGMLVAGNLKQGVDVAP